MDLFFWFLLTIGAPIVGPIFTLALAAATHGHVVARRLMIESVKDGQLLWSAMTLSASAIYEAVSALEASGAMPVPQFCIAMFCMTAFASSIIIMMETTRTFSLALRFTTTEERKPSEVSSMAYVSLKKQNKGRKGRPVSWGSLHGIELEAQCSGATF
jgi:flagellar biosynthesis component FlhA